MTTRAYSVRFGRFTAVMVGLATIATSVLIATPANAADPANFDPGYIISDANFFDGDAMSADQVQAHLDALMPICAAGYVCLRAFRQDTQTRAADSFCAGYTGAAQETAATIIAQVALSCNINPRVLLVTLQKEQSLVSATSPSAARYERAMGYYCPDDPARPGWCHPDFAGFFNQVYNAARQFQRYTLSPSGWGYRIGENRIRFSPNSTCGDSAVTIRNQATANLYIYTPYQPNPAALANLYGTGDGCSSYGNRNFWRIYTDWFGLPNPPLGADKFVYAVYQDVLGREPDPEGLRTWVGIVNSTGKRSVTSDAVLSSVEYRFNRIGQAYAEILGRGTDPSGVDLWLRLTGNGTLRIDEVTLVFMESDEYFARVGGTNAAFITAVYERYLGRAPGLDEIAYWEPLVDRYGRSSVTRSIYESVESAQGRIVGLYQHYLGRGIDPSGLATWTPVIRALGDNAIRSGLVQSEEYWLRAQARFPG